jgi:hypothetical protein
VSHQLTSLASGSRKTEAEYNVVEATFQLLQEYLRRLRLWRARLFQSSCGTDLPA